MKNKNDVDQITELNFNFLAWTKILSGIKLFAHSISIK